MIRTLSYSVTGGMVLAAICGAETRAQVSTPEQETGMARMRAAPTDHENTFDYARVSAMADDEEAAIAALERILAYNPKLTRVRYDLGLLHFKAGSYQEAVRYLEEALADNPGDIGLRHRIEALLPEARKQLSPSRWSGVLFAGARYNSNVAGAPAGGLIRFGGVDLPNTAQFQGRGDTSVFLMGDITHVYDFRTERPFTWETTISGYGSLQLSQTNLDLGFFDISTGPRFGLSADGLPGPTLRPYVVGGANAVSGASPVSSFGVGVTLSAPITKRLSLTPGVEIRKITANSGGALNGIGVINTGSLVTASLVARWLPMQRATVDAGVFFARNASTFANFGSNHIGLGASIKVDFDPPSETIGIDWSSTFFARFADITFDGPNAAIDPNITRHDRQYRFGAQLDMPIDPTFGFSAIAQYTINDSNLSNYRANAWSVMFGPTIRF